MSAGTSKRSLPDRQLTWREEHRLRVLRDVLDHRLSVREAAAKLGKSERQVYRLLKRVRREGREGVVHGNVGRPAPNRIDPELWAEVLRLARERYPHLSDRQLMDALERNHGIHVNRETLRLHLRAAGIVAKRRTGPGRPT
jgi:transposase